MSDLTRFRDAPDAEGELVRELLADEEWAEPPPAAEAAVWANLLVALPPGALLPGAPAASGGASATAGSGGSGVASAGALTKLALLGGTTKVFVISAVITGSGILGWGIARESLEPRSTGNEVEAGRSPPATPGAAVRPGVGAGPHQARTDGDGLAGASAEPRRLSAAEPELPGQLVPMGRVPRKVLPELESGGVAPTPPVGSSGLNEESALLAAARGALRRGALDEAKRFLDEHQARFASGRLIQERQALRIEALWHAGGRDAARRQFESYRRAYPGSPHTSRLGHLVGARGSMGAAK